MTADIVAVVVRWRGGDEVSSCVRSLLAHGGGRLAGVTLVDSGSGDGGAQRLAAEFPDVRVLALEDNLGFAHAANRGASGHREDYVLLLNPDTEVRPGSLAELAAGLDDHPELSGTVPVLEGSDGRSQDRWQLRRLPSLLRLSTGRPGAPAFVTAPAEPLTVQQPAAAAWLVRRSVWEALGGLDEGFAPAWWEDVDFCARLETRLGTGSFPTSRGFMVRPRSRMLHHGGSSVASLGDEAFKVAYTRNLLRYAALHHNRGYSGIRAGLRVTLAIQALVRPGQRHACLTALRALKRARPEARAR